jgi:hypothetical protein
VFFPGGGGKLKQNIEGTQGVKVWEPLIYTIKMLGNEEVEGKFFSRKWLIDNEEIAYEKITFELGRKEKKNCSNKNVYIYIY